MRKFEYILVVFALLISGCSALYQSNQVLYQNDYQTTLQAQTDNIHVNIWEKAGIKILFIDYRSVSDQDFQLVAADFNGDNRFDTFYLAPDMIYNIGANSSYLRVKDEFWYNNRENLNEWLLAVDTPDTPQKRITSASLYPLLQNYFQDLDALLANPRSEFLLTPFIPAEPAETTGGSSCWGLRGFKFTVPRWR